MRIYALAVLMLVFLTAPGWAYKATPGARACDIYGRNVQDNSVVHLEDYFGSWVLVDFTATWCGPCMREFPHFVEVTGRFHDKGLQVLGVSLDSDRSAASLLPILKKNAATFPVIYQGGQFDTPPAMEWGISSVPQQFLVNPQGVIVSSGLQGESLEPLLEYYLSGASDTPIIAVERAPYWDAEQGTTGVDLMLTSPYHLPLQVELVWSQFVYQYATEEARKAGDSCGADWYVGDGKPICRTVEFGEFCDKRIRIEVPLARDAVGLENIVRVKIPGTDSMMNGQGLWIESSGWIDIGHGADNPFYY